MPPPSSVPPPPSVPPTPSVAPPPSVPHLGVPPDALLRVRNLVAGFRTRWGERRVVDGASFDISAGAHVAMIGGSGSGKTTLALALFGLLGSLDGYVESGQVWFDGVDLLELTDAAMHAYRGSRIAMVFQDPTLALQPAIPVGQQIARVVRSRQGVGIARAREIGVEWLHAVGIASPSLSMSVYPHELSGGSQRRIMVAMALACEPDLLIADDPTVGLDPMVQGHVLELVRKASASRKMAVLHIAHDLGVVAEFADRLLVMSNGMIVESGTVEEVFRTPQHPSTQELLGSGAKDSPHA